MTMKPDNIAANSANSSSAEGSNHNLWIGGDGENVLTITINKRSRAFPPDADQCAHLNQMIQGLARAAKDVIFRANNDVRVATDFAMQPVEDIVDAIIVLSQLSEAIRSEVQA